jgi:transcriptional regulator with XRE-family HTH domain
MPHPRLQNYLRAYRRKSGLTQREVAFLLGCQNGGVVSRYEKRRRLPPLPTALACQAVFGVPVSELFAGMWDTVDGEIKKRLTQLRSRLQDEPGKGREARLAAQKLRWLADRHGMAAGSQEIT